MMLIHAVSARIRGIGGGGLSAPRPPRNPVYLRLFVWTAPGVTTPLGTETDVTTARLRPTALGKHGQRVEARREAVPPLAQGRVRGRNAEARMSGGLRDPVAVPPDRNDRFAPDSSHRRPGAQDAPGLGSHVPLGIQCSRRALAAPSCPAGNGSAPLRARTASLQPSRRLAREPPAARSARDWRFRPLGIAVHPIRRLHSRTRNTQT